MTHCNAPQSCSVCLGAEPRRVEIVAGRVTVDGKDIGVNGSHDPANIPKRKRGQFRGKR